MLFYADPAAGVATEMFSRMLEKLGGLYDVSLIRDRELQPFYERFGMRPASAMMLPDYDRQSGG
ncbi:MAG: hypothetical protein ACR2GU_04785 [Rubrobacteraceae bacterium]